MPRRAAQITQADIARTIRALREEGLPVLRAVVRSDGVALETTQTTVEVVPALAEVAESRPVVVL